jgi:tetratricopeptide (TPR) repeat protein
MSLIHDALKKLEATDYGGPPEDLSYGNVSFRRRSRGILVASLFILSVLVGILLYISRGEIPFKLVMLERISPSFEGITPATEQPLAEGEEPDADGASGPTPAPHQQGATYVDEKLITSEVTTPNNEKGIKLFKAGRFEEALDEFRAAEALKPESPELYNNMGLTLMEVNETGQAEKAFKRALELRPDYAEALNNYGALIDRGGSSESAMSLFERAIMLSPSYPDPHLNLAITLERLGRYAEALSHYEGFLEKGGGDEFLRKEVMNKTRRLRFGTIIKTR